jgi:deferrochelatase/peroxidase EfeB
VMADDVPTLELDDIQNGVLHPRPLPYVATYVLIRIDDRRAGREMLRRLIPNIASAADPMSPQRDAWLSVALTYQGLKAVGVPQASLDRFPAFHDRVLNFPLLTDHFRAARLYYPTCIPMAGHGPAKGSPGGRIWVIRP